MNIGIALVEDLSAELCCARRRSHFGLQLRWFRPEEVEFRSTRACLASLPITVRQYNAVKGVLPILPTIEMPGGSLVRISWHFQEWRG